MREDAIRHSLRPAAHQDGPEQAKHQEQPNRAGEGPSHMFAQLLLLSQKIGSKPPCRDRNQQEERRNNIPATIVQWWHAQTMLRARRLKRQPKSLS